MLSATIGACGNPPVYPEGTWERVFKDAESFGGRFRDPGRDIGMTAVTVVSGATSGGPSRLIAVGYDRKKAAVWVSDDGYDWRRIAENAGEFSGANDAARRMNTVTSIGSYVVAAGEGMISACDQDGEPMFWSSNDRGETWQRATYDTNSMCVPGRGAVLDIAADATASKLIAVGTAGFETATDRVGAIWEADMQRGFVEAGAWTRDPVRGTVRGVVELHAVLVSQHRVIAGTGVAYYPGGTPTLVSYIDVDGTWRPIPCVRHLNGGYIARTPVGCPRTGFSVTTDSAGNFLHTAAAGIGSRPAPAGGVYDELLYTVGNEWFVDWDGGLVARFDCTSGAYRSPYGTCPPGDPDFAPYGGWSSTGGVVGSDCLSPATTTATRYCQLTTVVTLPTKWDYRWNSATMGTDGADAVVFKRYPGGTSLQGWERAGASNAADAAALGGEGTQVITDSVAYGDNTLIMVGTDQWPGKSRAPAVWRFGLDQTKRPEVRQISGAGAQQVCGLIFDYLNQVIAVVVANDAALTSGDPLALMSVENAVQTLAQRLATEVKGVPLDITMREATDSLLREVLAHQPSTDSLTDLVQACL